MRFVVCPPPQSKILATLRVQWLVATGYSLFDVIRQCYVGLFFGLELELVMIRAGATFRL